MPFDFPNSPTADQLIAGPTTNFVWKGGNRWQRTSAVPPVPPPVLTSLAPDNAYVGSAAQAVQVNGEAFDDTTEIVWDGVAFLPTYVSETQLTMSVSGVGETARDVPVETVKGGVTSNSLPFHFIPAPPDTPWSHSIIPDTISALSVATFTLHGEKLLSTASIGTNHPTATVQSFALVDDASLTFVIDTLAFNLGYWAFTAKNADGEGSGNPGIQINV